MKVTSPAAPEPADKMTLLKNWARKELQVDVKHKLEFLKVEVFCSASYFHVARRTNYLAWSK
jgi:hypothetical protein